MKTSFLIRLDDLCILDVMDNAQAGALLKAIHYYLKYGVLPYTEQWIIIAATPIIRHIKEDADKIIHEFDETYVYTIMLTKGDESFIKIGISYFLDKRYSDYKRCGYEVEELMIEKFTCKSDAEAREYDLHQQFSIYKYNPAEKFAGYTECFSLDLLNYMAI